MGRLVWGPGTDWVDDGVCRYTCGVGWGSAPAPHHPTDPALLHTLMIVGGAGVLRGGAWARRRAHRGARAPAALVAPPVGPDHGPLRLRWVLVWVV